MSRPRASAFTMIEVLIAIALGMVVVLTAMAGVRVAGAAVSTATRLSIENGLMRAGWHEAHHQLDYWTAYDDPDRTDAQQLRATGASHDANHWLANWPQRPVGLPFTPLGDPGSPLPTAGAVPRAARGIAPRPPNAVDDVSWEDDAGFDPSYAWAPHDPRTWWRGNLVERGYFFDHGGGDGWGNRRELGWWGRYAMFTNADASPRLIEWPVQLEDDSWVAVDYAMPEPVAHRWQARQIQGFGGALGYFGMFEYLPSNTLLGAYTTYDGVGFTGIPAMWNFSYHGRPYNFHVHLDTPRTGSDLCMGLFRATFGACALIEIPRQVGYEPTAEELLRDHYKQFDTDYTIGNGNYNNAQGTWGEGARLSYEEFLRKTIHPVEVLPLSPAHWPRASAAVGHFVKNNRPVSMCKIRWTSPITGEVAELSFAALGTTLRGARQQRGRSGGWARWDDAPAATNDPTLDGP